jgi:hypothetical protein
MGGGDEEAERRTIALITACVLVPLLAFTALALWALHTMVWTCCLLSALCSPIPTI